MKLSYENKVEIYHLRKAGISWSKIIQKFEVNKSNLKYMVGLIDKYEQEILDKGKNRYYSPQSKKEIIAQVLKKEDSQGEVSLDYAFPNRGTLPQWIAQYKKNGYTVVEKTGGRMAKMRRKPKKKLEELTELERLQHELEYLRAENAVLKS